MGRLAVVTDPVWERMGWMLAKVKHLSVAEFLLNLQNHLNFSKATYKERLPSSLHSFCIQSEDCWSQHCEPLCDCLLVGATPASLTVLKPTL